MGARVPSEALSTLCVSAVHIRNGRLVLDWVAGAPPSGGSVDSRAMGGGLPSVGLLSPDRKPRHHHQHYLQTRKVIPTELDHFSNVSKCFGVYQNTNSFKGVTEFLVVFFYHHLFSQSTDTKSLMSIARGLIGNKLC